MKVPFTPVPPVKVNILSAAKKGPLRGIYLSLEISGFDW
jgi:hypothetical protein